MGYNSSIRNTSTIKSALSEFHHYGELKNDLSKVCTASNKYKITLLGFDTLLVFVAKCNPLGSAD